MLEQAVYELGYGISSVCNCPPKEERLAPVLFAVNRKKKRGLCENKYGNYNINIYINIHISIIIERSLPDAELERRAIGTS